MGVKFKIKIKHPESSQIDHFITRDGDLVTEKIAGELETEVVKVVGRRIAETAAEQRERTLFMAAVFFHRVINRTPVDENYYYLDKNGNLKTHEKDDDAVRDFWIAKYNNKKVTSKELRESGITFDTFNDEVEIRKIYEIFRKAFIQHKDKRILIINIENTHQRFAMLEYGEYMHDGDIKRGEYYHGVQNGYSVQAPYGMLRITEAEFEQMVLNTSSEKMIKDYAKKSKRLTKIPSKSKILKLRRIIKDKTHLSKEDIKQIERIYE